MSGGALGTPFPKLSILRLLLEAWLQDGLSDYVSLRLVHVCDVLV